ncbi:MAG TPA: nucleotide disphospho-sugar-binding domain-containing protein [Crinalium sp.]|jgi:hypothetical protein
MKVLLGWELGAGQGHLQRLLALAERLSNQGWTPIFALKSFNVQGMNFPWHSMVAPRLPFSGREDSFTFADLLGTFGFAQADLLRTHLHSWHEILKEVNPDLVITDHAPGLVLATHGTIPTLVVGSHFAVPPPIENFPIFRFPAPPESEECQRQVSETVRQVVPLATSLGQALNGDRSFIFSIPELDCYRAWRHLSPTTHYASIHIAPLPRSQPYATGHAWAYLAQNYAPRDLVLSTLYPDTQFKPLHEVLVDKAIAIHHGGLTTSVACLLAGVPQLILPRYLEQQINGRALLQLGVAEMLTAPTWDDLLMAQAQVHNLVEQAQAVAEHLASWNHNFLDTIVEACFQLAC